MSDSLKEKKYLIVGQGLAGSVLALTFFKKNIPFHIIGYHQAGEASMASSGLINPVTGRRYVKAWLIDELIEKALEFYSWTEVLLEDAFFFPVDIVRFLSNHEAIAAWKKREADIGYKNYITNKKLSEIDLIHKPYGIVSGGYRLETQKWLQKVRIFLVKHNLLTFVDKPFVHTSISNQKIIYCTGAFEPLHSKGLIPNKGEALIVKIKDWKLPAIIKEKIYFIPLKEKNTFWVGSLYHPWPDQVNPTDTGKLELLDAISEMYPYEVEILEHLSGVRPTVDDRRPLIGLHPSLENTYVFNGMGTKGTSLAPYWAEQFAGMLTQSESLPYIVDPMRYENR